MTKNNTDIGFVKQIWDAACVLWGHISKVEHRKVIVGLIFLKYVSTETSILSLFSRFNLLEDKKRISTEQGKYYACI